MQVSFVRFSKGNRSSDLRDVPRSFLNCSQDLILNEERVDDHPEYQSNDHGDEEDGLEKMPRTLHSRFRAAGPALAAAVLAGNTARLQRRRGRDAVRRRRRFHLSQLRLIRALDLRFRQLGSRRALHLQLEKSTVIKELLHAAG